MKISFNSFFKIFILFITFLLFTLCPNLFVSKAYASSEFSTSYKISYNIDSQGRSHVIQDIALTNLTTQFYATKFSLTLGVLKAENVTAKDGLGQLEVASAFEDNKTAIDVTLIQKIVGIGKSYNFTIEYDAPELATKIGQIWEINIPKLASSENVTGYDVTISVPNNFGPAAFITPNPITKDELQGRQIFTFNKDQLEKSGVSASFGQKQIFSFNIKYHLKNNNFFPQLTEIALPPDTNYQKLIYKSIKPSPIDVYVDRDGNWLAKYQLAPKSKLDILANGQVQIYPNPKNHIDEKLSEQQKALYLIPQPFWETNNPKIEQKAKELKSAKEIYDFVALYLSYNQKRLEAENVKRLGAAEAFSDPDNSVCMEFTDLFITLARAAGIPAREINGFAYTENERLRPLSLSATNADVLHAWPEYWDTTLNAWIQVDPTWANTSGGIDYFTKLDFNHFTFVRKGINSQEPIPAGAYKFETSNSKDVEVSLAKNLDQEKGVINILPKLPNRIFSAFQVKSKINIANNGNTAVYAKVLKIETQNLEILSSPIVPVAVLPPFSNHQLEISFISPNILAKGKGQVSLILDDQRLEHEVTIQSALYLYIAVSLIFSLLFGSFAVILYKFHHRRISV